MIHHVRVPVNSGGRQIHHPLNESSHRRNDFGNRIWLESGNGVDQAAAFRHK